MIQFLCPGCGKALEADDARAGCMMRCEGCGGETVIPMDLACDDLPSEPGAPTITLEELESLRRELPPKPKS